MTNNNFERKIYGINDTVQYQQDIVCSSMAP